MKPKTKKKNSLQWGSACQPGGWDPKDALNYLHGTFLTWEWNKLTSLCKLTMKCPADDRWIFSENTCFLVGPHENECLFMEPTVMLSFVSSLLSEIAENCPSLAQWHSVIPSAWSHSKGRNTSFLTLNIGVLCLDRNANRKAGSQPSHRFCLLSNTDAGGISNQGNPLSCQLSQSARKARSTTHLSNFITKPCSFP